MKLITVTLNLAIDVTLMCNDIHYDRANRVITELREAGGKGVNVSRVAKNFSLEGCAFALAGKENCSEYRNLLGDSAGKFVAVEIEGRIRENLTLRSVDKCLKFNRMGATASKEDLSRLLDEIKTVLNDGDLVALSGSVTPGISEQMLTDFCLEIKALGGKILLDTESISLENLIKIKPFVIKPNLHEFSSLFGSDNMPPKRVLSEMENLYEAGVENILLTLGDKGMKALCGGKFYDAGSLSVEVKSNVCAGDSSLAGFAVGVIRNMDISDCIKLACACGTATVMCEGSGVCSEKNALDLMNKIPFNG